MNSRLRVTVVGLVHVLACAVPLLSAQFALRSLCSRSMRPAADRVCHTEPRGPGDAH